MLWVRFDCAFNPDSAMPLGHHPAGSSDFDNFFQAKESSMGNTTMGQITIVYRGATQQFKTVSLAEHYLRQTSVKVGWFHTIQAAVDLMMHDEISETRRLKGDKYYIMEELKQLESDLKLSLA
jgi:hypothetical protein